jgi:hypothetical protein
LDYVKNRTHWTENGAEVVFDGAIKVSGSTMHQAFITLLSPLVAGAQYSVTFNGTSYTLTAGADSGYVYVGDWDANYTTIPFLLYSDGFTHTFETKQNGTYNFTLKNNNGTVYHTLNEKFIPDTIMRANNPVGTGSFSMNRMAGTTVGQYSHAEGNNTTASGMYSHAEGHETQATGESSHAEGEQTVAYGWCSHAEGIYMVDNEGNFLMGTTAEGAGSHAEGGGCQAQGDISHAEGQLTIASGVASHAEGGSTIDEDGQIVLQTEASGDFSHAEGMGCLAQGDYSHAEGAETTASNYSAHSEGEGSTASGMASHAEGAYTQATGTAAHAEGYGTIAGQYQHASGKYNVSKTAPTSVGTQDSTNADAIFMVGCGTAATRKNAFRISSGGKCFGTAAFGASGADFAELFEWADGNPNNEDRRGLFVTLDGEKIRIANAGDDCIGVISGAQAFVGNSASEEWQGKYLTDVFGAKISKEVEIPEVVNEKTGKVIEPAHKAVQYVLNPDYNPDEEYVMRENRKEWGIVGLVGQIVMIDDGTCVVGGRVAPSANGIGTASNDGYRVMKRIDENHIKVLVK